MLKNTCKLFIICSILSVGYAALTIPMALTKNGQSIGSIQVKNTPHGLLLTPNLHGLKPGSYGFHLHKNPSCADHGNDAGGHFDPFKTRQHLGPYNNKGHLGDLPVLMVNKNGTATIPVLAPRLTVKFVENHSLMIHAGSDSYSDNPHKLGGGGARIACGVVLKKH